MNKRFEESKIITEYFKRLLPEGVCVQTSPNLRNRVFELSFSYIYDRTYIRIYTIMVCFKRWKQFLNKEGYYFAKEIRDGYVQKTNRQAN